MADSKMHAYLHNRDGQKDQLDALPDDVQQELAAHLAFYLRDPAGAHLWDPVVIGVPGGPVKTLLIAYTGRKTGRPLHVVLQYYELGGEIAIVASKGGTVENPAWYASLLDNPDCRVQIGRFRSHARIRTVEGAQRALWWDSICREQPIQKQYQSRTSRLIPIAVLVLATPFVPEMA